MAPPSDDEVQRILGMEAKEFIRMIQDTQFPALPQTQEKVAKSIHDRFLEIIACLAILPGPFDVRVSTKPINVIMITNPTEATQDQLESAVQEVMTDFASAKLSTHDTLDHLAVGTRATKLLLDTLEIQCVATAEVEQVVEIFLGRSRYEKNALKMEFKECTKAGLGPVALVLHFE